VFETPVGYVLPDHYDLIALHDLACVRHVESGEEFYVPGHIVEQHDPAAWSPYLVSRSVPARISEFPAIYASGVAEYGFRLHPVDDYHYTYEDLRAGGTEPLDFSGAANAHDCRNILYPVHKRMCAERRRQGISMERDQDIVARINATR